ncbi:MAG TPA: radical SAM family heme chaperone HemW [Actinomycetota bacterium]
MKAGLYVHIPFCLTRCGYCDFNTYAGLDHLAGGYVDTLVREAELWAPDWRSVEFVSLFFGGGTPTTLPSPRLVKLLDQVRAGFSFTPGAEITSEANPDTIDEPYLRALLDAGVSRLSMGVQSFDPAVLGALERIHSPEAALRAFAAARRAGFTNVNLDLIYGAHGETLDAWHSTVRRAIELGPEHLSCYALTIEPATPLGRKVAAGLVPPPDPELQADMYELACQVLAEAGYEHYEVSNWSRPGYRCFHNMGYWEGRPYLGLGAGAHSYRDGIRRWNVRPPQQYMASVAAGRKPVGGEEKLTEEDQKLERLLLGLRVADGVPAKWVDPVRAEPFLAKGLAERRDGRLALTDRGLFVANALVLEFFGS